MTRTALTAGLLALATAAPALSAGVTEVAVNRYNLAAAEGGFNTDGPVTTTGPSSGLWDDKNFRSAVDGGNGGTGVGIQNSTIANGAYSALVDARADAFGDGSDFASGYGQSHFAVDFNLGAGGGVWTLDGFLNAFGTINGEISEAYINLIDLSTSTVIWGASVNDEFQMFSESGSLAAGNYRIEADALAIVDRIFESGFGDSTSTVDFNFTVTPAPGAVSLLAMGGVGMASRRRRG